MTGILTKYDVVIGLEVHAQLSTNTKIFCGCSAASGSEPNSNICPVCLGHPGTLPVLNKKALEYAVLMGIATQSTINQYSTFARKNYFYPDLPKGYQISQFDLPVCENGFLEISSGHGETKTVRIKRIHLEEDAGKSIHDRGNSTLIDVNRCGVPLIEIVTEPDFSSAFEATDYLMKIRQIVRYLGICDGNMEEGSLRCDANVSLKIKGEERLGTKTELKNMNSFKNVEKAINYEIERQFEILEEGGSISQQTLLWNPDKNEAYPMRSKEDSHDYRYFPDPDLIPVTISNEMLSEIRSMLPELPGAKIKKFTEIYLLPEYDSSVLTQEREIAEFFEEVCKQTLAFKEVSNWMMTEVLKILNEKKITISEFNITPQNFAGLINEIKSGSISGKIAKDVFADMLETGKDAASIIDSKNLKQISDPALIEPVVKSLFDANKQKVNELLEGKEKIFGFFVGQVMKSTSGKANPALVNELIKKELENRKNE
ncbi:MAG: Asp-tRNA(Asn)/Glu-tRNA(Gln) amidotransferase subunit GatB [Ignavibacteriaceae bacterium]|nr:Asp-tRNA(Asn)/Glu-tRNA(Gln) amidotransferase subunit GatB [Ignavibacteriaceae bacterium]